jgi:hypothetical protein
MLDKYIYKFLDFVMEWSGKINAWAWVKHLKYIEKRRFERYFGKKKEKTTSELLEEGFNKEQEEYLKELKKKL